MKPLKETALFVNLHTHTMKYRSMEEKTAAITIIAIVAALALLGLVMVLVANNLALQEAEAGCERGAGFNRSIEKSNGRCFDRGTF